MADDAAIAMLTTLGEAGGITGLVALSIAIIVRMIKKRGCTCKLNNCSGESIVEVDCEDGAPNRRYLPTQPKTESSVRVVVEETPPPRFMTGDSL